MALRLIAAAKTDVGQQREQNEDSCFAQTVEEDGQSYGLYIVADGMGGYHAGEVASKIAVEKLSESLTPLLGPQSHQPTQPLRATHPPITSAGTSADTSAATDETQADVTSDSPIDAAEANTPADSARDPGENATRPLAETLADHYYTERLREAVKQCSRDVVAYGLAHKEARGLGSTVTAALVIEEQAFVANVGDSRTYLYRGGALQRLTRDHSLVERLVEAGQIQPEDVYDHPSRNLVYRSLGAGHAEVDVDIFVVTLQAGDALLLCSDGLWEMVHDPEMTSILSEVEDPTAAADVLIERANQNGGEDNITAVLVRCLAR